MEFFSSTIRLQFVQNELAREYFEFPVEFDEAYSRTRGKLRRFFRLSKGQNIDKFPSDLNSIDKPLDKAREFTSLLPAHTLKVYVQLLKCEEDSAKKDSFFILDKPINYLIDIGCGGGSASIALLMLLSKYHQFRVQRNYPIYPTQVHLLGIDPIPYSLKIYSSIISEVTQEISKSLIGVEHRILKGRLSTDTVSVLEWLDSYEIISSCIFAFANVIRPFSAEFSEEVKEQRSISKRLNLINRVEEVGVPEIRSINSILEHVSVDRAGVVVISSPTKGSSQSSRGGNNWLRETRKFINTASRQLNLSGHFVTRGKGINQVSINILGPQKGRFRLVRKDNEPHPVDYNAGFLLIEGKHFVEIKKDWDKILDKENLLLAWARVRNEMSEATLEDTLEIRLFEINIQNRLDQLRCRILSYDFESLGVNKMINYLVPKGFEKDPRPMSICRLEEQILAVAILQVKSKEYAGLPSNSYAYHLSSKKGKENLYQNWFEAHQSFINNARAIASEHSNFYVIQTDLSSFYTMIDQKRLLDEFNHLIRWNDNRFCKFSQYLIIRDCGISSVGKGLPQGHIISGALANLYLLPIDKIFESDNNRNIHYFRYVDDMIIIFPPDTTPEEVLEQLDAGLKELGLIRSKDKTTSAMTATKFLEVTEFDGELEKLSKSFNYLLADLYRLNSANYNLLKLNWWRYLCCYQRLLSSIGYYISIPRLSRKIKQNLGWWKRWFVVNLGLLPRPCSFADLENIEEWKKLFVINNAEWVRERLRIHQEIKINFEKSLQALNDRNADEMVVAQGKRRFRFSVNRLGKLGFDEFTDAIVDIVINRPWLVNVRRVCDDLALQGREDALVKIIEISTSKSGNEFVRSCAIKSLQLLTSKQHDLLNYDVIDEEASQIENLMLTETTLLSKATPPITSNDIVCLIRTSNLHDAVKRNLSLQVVLDDSEIVGHQFEFSVNEAIQFKSKLTPQEFNTLYLYEPDILREKFYLNSYPDDDSEFPDFPSWI